MIPSLYDRFQNWCKNGSVYIISDTHFNDQECTSMYENWKSPDEAVEIINKIVHKNDTLIHLGDVGDIEFAKKIKAYKVLILGNHDTGISKYKDVFDEVYEGALLIGPKILLSHEPIPNIDWCLNIHGHDHMNYVQDDFHLNLSSNLCDFTPMNLGEYIKKYGLSKIKTVREKSIAQAIENKESKKLTGKSIYD